VVVDGRGQGHGQDVEVRRVDVADEARLRAWWEVGHAVTVADRPYDAWAPWELSRQALPAARDDLRLVLLTAHASSGAVLGSAMVVLPDVDDTHCADVTVWVAPAHRCGGVGTTLLASAEAAAAAEGRRTLRSEAFESLLDPRSGGGAGPAFAARHDYAVAEENTAKLLDLATAPELWPPLEAEVAECLATSGGHRVEVCVGRVPEAYAEGVCAVLSAFVGLLPPSERDAGDVRWDVDRLRAGEARNAAHDRTQVLALALAPDDAVVGFSDVRVDAPQAPVAGVGGTLVLPGHRGHRLGLAMKLATHRRLLALRAEGRLACTHVDTQNATDNAAMNHVNERLGYRAAERALDLQKRVTASPR
jgi:GNAT superfamily N-acetyltransferase